MSMLHIKLSNKWTLTNIKLTKVTDVSCKIRRLEWQWTRHVIRSARDKWTRDYFGTPGMGKEIEEDNTRGERRTYLKDYRRDRNKWQQPEEAYVMDGQPDVNVSGVN